MRIYIYYAFMKRAGKPEKKAIVENYFHLIANRSKNYDRGTERLMAFWHMDGVYEITGFNNDKEVYEGQLAIHTYYLNMLTGARNIPAHMGDSATANFLPVELSVEQTLEEDHTVISYWSAAINAPTKKQLLAEGSHTFIFHKGKIKQLYVNVSLSADLLSVDQLGIINSSVLLRSIIA